MNAWGYTDVGKQRKENQDAYYIDINEEWRQAVCVVCDGMGGAKAGNIASKVAIDAFVGRIQGLLRPKRSIEQLKAILQDAIEYANDQVHTLAKSEPQYHGMGTTLVAIVISEDSAVIANIGDSRAYFADQDGIHKVTRDHSLVEDMVILGKLTEEQAKDHPNKNIITRAVGTDEKVAVDLYEFALVPDSFLLLCSDGLSNLVSDQEMLYEIIHGGDSANCCRRLTEIANARGGFDNITSVLLAL